MALLTTASGGITGQYQKYMDREMLPHAVQSTVYGQFGQRKSLPKNQASKVIRFTRGDVAAASNVGSTGEGLPTTVFRDYTYTFVDATLAQNDLAAKVSDVLNWTDLFSTVDNVSKAMGEDIALFTDGAIRNELVASITGAGNRRYVGTTQTYAGIAATTPATGRMQISDVLNAMTRLEITRAPKLKGEYIIIVGPQVNRDILNDAKVVLAGQYGTSKALYNAEVGTWYNTRFVLSSNPFIEDGTNAAGEGVFDVPTLATDAIYRSFVVGSDGYGIPILGGQSPFNPQSMICNKADKSDPTNKFITIGMKCFWVSKTLNDQWVVSISSKSEYVG
jgi:N4-gp56 family major capsid protein